MNKNPPPCTRTCRLEPSAVRLIHDISRIMHERIRKSCPEMQRSCRLILMELSRQDNVTQLDLVRATHLKAPTVSVSLQKMERNGIVKRCQDSDDLRATRVFLTEQGRVLDAQIIEKIKERESEAEACLTKEEIETLMHLLTKIKNSLLGGTDHLETR